MRSSLQRKSFSSKSSNLLQLELEILKINLVSIYLCCKLFILVGVLIIKVDFVHISKFRGLLANTFLCRNLINF